MSSVKHLIRPRGFTLIEMVLAITLAVGLIGTAIWFYRHAGEVRADVSSRTAEIAARRQIMERITSDLRGAVMLGGTTGTMSGTTDRITFVTTTLPGKGMWAAPNITETPRPAEQDLRQVSYGLSVWEDDYGVKHINGFDNQVQKILNPIVIEEGDTQQVQSALLSNRILFARFQFWDGAAWQIEWKDKPSLPVAVEVVLGETPLEEGADPLQYSSATIRRVVFLPGGAPTAQSDTIIQGLNP